MILYLRERDLLLIMRVNQNLKKQYKSPLEKVIFAKIGLWLSISYEAKNSDFVLFQVDSYNNNF